MSYNLSMQQRLDCQRSYADEQSPHLLCSMGGVCDGSVYDCCLWDMSQSEIMELMSQNENND